VIVRDKPGASGMLGPNELMTANLTATTLSQITIGVVRLPTCRRCSSIR